MQFCAVLACVTGRRSTAVLAETPRFACVTCDTPFAYIPKILNYGTSQTYVVMGIL